MTGNISRRSDTVSRGRRVECQCCGRRLIVRGGQVWRSRMHDASLVIISAERDGAIVEQIGRDDRWGITYRDLLASFKVSR